MKKSVSPQSHGNARLKLADGRWLAYSQIGAAGGRPVIYLHGNPGSRLEMLRPAYLEAFNRAELRVISIDRPGYGDSDPPLAKGHLPFTADVRALMNHIALPRAVVVGHSRGTLPAISLGVLMAERIAAVGVFGPTGLPDDPEIIRCQSLEARLMLKLVKSLPAVARALFRLNSVLDQRFPKNAAQRMSRFITSPADREQLRLSGHEFVNTLAAGMRRDPGFAIDDWRSWLVDPLGFDPTRIQVPLLLWIGVEDGLCPLKLVEAMAARIESARLSTLPGFGHLHSPAMLVKLMQATIESSSGGQ